MFSFLTVFFVLTSVSCLSRETGLVQLRWSSENPYDCSQSLPVFVCTTSGLGETRISLSSVAGEPIRLRHSRYTNVSTTMTITEHNYHELIAAVNLSKSSDKECLDPVNNRMDFCYTTMFIVHLTDQTVCNTINCYTVFNNGSHDISEQFGSATITTMPPAPANFRIMKQSLVDATFIWDHVINNCSNIHYHLLILNCGTCPSTVSTPDNSITCKDLVPGQQCSMTLQAIQPCGFSEAIIQEVLIGGKPTSAPVIQGTPNVGAVTGGVIAVLLILLLLSTVIISIVIYTKKSRSQVRSKQQNTAGLESSCANANVGDCQQGDKDTELQKMEESLKRARTDSVIADERKKEAEKREAAAQNEAAQAREEAYRLQLEEKDIEEQIEKHKEDLKLKETLENCLERARVALANADKRKCEAELREAKAHEEKVKADEDAYKLHLKQSDIEGRVKIYKDKRASRCDSDKNQDHH